MNQKNILLKFSSQIIRYLSESDIYNFLLALQPLNEDFLINIDKLSIKNYHENNIFLQLYPILRLKYLYFTNKMDENKIKTIIPITYSLKKLYLEDVFIYNIEMQKNITSCTIDVLNIQNISINFNVLSKLKSIIEKNKIVVKTINLKFNNIVNLEDNYLNKNKKKIFYNNFLKLPQFKIFLDNIEELYFTFVIFQDNFLHLYNYFQLMPKNLKKISFNHTNLDDKILSMINISQFKYLQELYIDFSLISKNFKLVDMDSLEHLSLYHLNIKTDLILNLKNLKTLNLSNCHLLILQINHRDIKLPNLTTLNIDSSKNLFFLRFCGPTILQNLNISNTKIHFHTLIEDLQLYNKNPETGDFYLKTLTMENFHNDIVPIDLNLRILNLSYNKITEKYNMFIKKNKNLKYLILINCKLDAIPSSLIDRNIFYLDISHNPLRFVKYMHLKYVTKLIL